MTQPPYPPGSPAPDPQAWPGQGAYGSAAPAFPPAPPTAPPGVPGGGGPGDDRSNNGGKGPKLPGGVIALIVLAIVVVVGVIAFIAFDSLTRDHSEQASPAPAPAASSAPGGDDGSLGGGDTEGATPTAGGDRPDDLQSFDAKSGNIHCEIGTNYARCLIDHVNPEFEQPDAPENCNAPNYGRVAVATKDKVGYDCTEASMPTGGKVLGYGKSISKSGIKCTSTKKGMECYADGGKGFRIARAGIAWSK